MSDTLLDKFTGSGDILDFIFENLLERISIIFHGFLSFFISVFGYLGKEVVAVGDIVSDTFQKQGFTSFNNFFFAFIGFVVLFFCVKSGIKLLLKMIELIGNYIPFT